MALATAVSAGVLLNRCTGSRRPTKVTWPTAIKVQAAPATENDIEILYHFIQDTAPTAQPGDGLWTHVIFEGAGITTVEHTDRPSCFLPSPENQLPPKSVHCPDGTSVESYPGVGEDFAVFLEDRNDVFESGR